MWVSNPVVKRPTCLQSLSRLPSGRFRTTQDVHVRDFFALQPRIPICCFMSDKDAVTDQQGARSISLHARFVAPFAKAEVT